MAKIKPILVLRIAQANNMETQQQSFVKTAHQHAQCVPISHSVRFVRTMLFWHLITCATKNAIVVTFTIIKEIVMKNALMVHI